MKHLVVNVRHVLIAAGLYLVMPAISSSAYADDRTLVNGAKQCTRQLPRFERQYGIPTHLLSAIAATESGRFHKGLELNLPWPWTINADGKGYYFDTKQEAITKVNRLRARGVKSIDVGCMQVNLFYHGHAFASLEEAFDPQHNVAYAASFLRSLYQEQKSWKKAAAYYHSRKSSRGRKYVGHVYDRWYTIVDRLRMAQVRVPDSSIREMKGLKKSDRWVRTASSKDRPYGAKEVELPGNVKPVSKIKIVRLPEQRGKQLAAFETPRMNSIKIKHVPASRIDKGLITVKPDIKVVENNGANIATNIPISNVTPSSSKVITVAQALSSAPKGLDFMRQDVSDTAVSADSSRVTLNRRGPNFIFGN